MNHTSGRCKFLGLVIIALIPIAAAVECPPDGTMTPPDNTNTNVNDNDNTPAGNPTPNPADGTWALAFDASNVGALSGVWGSGPNDVFVVGGRTSQGEIYHFDGTTWRAMDVPSVSLLVWVYGFGPNDVYAVGLAGGAVHYDGTSWKKLSTGTGEELWGIWGASPNDIWIVGGTVGTGDPVLMHYDGQSFTNVPVPANDRGATSIFKVWGDGTKVIAVGEKGLIIEYDGNSWKQVPAGANADDDFVSLWGTSPSNIVAVGGRATARIGRYDGTGWTTFKPGGAGLNACFMDNPDFAVIGGVGGYVGRFEPGATAPINEVSPTDFDVHAIWGDGSGRYFAVGGVFSPPYRGVALIRFLGDPPAAAVPPEGVADQCASDAACNDNNPCTLDRCINGECVSTPIDCDDGDPCTIDTCVNGNCVHTPMVCDDGNPCTTDACVNGVCVFTPVNCNDNNPCTVDTCVNGVCSNLPRNCDDGDPCTFDYCDNGVCVHEAICLPNEICVNGVCESAPDCFDGGDCDDGNPCTIDTCENGQCVFTPMECDDGSPCTVDTCENGVCVFTPIDCDDGDPCTIDTCGLATLKGDLNDDCLNDVNDMPPFVEVLLGSITSPGMIARGDMDGDGVADGRDIPLFVGAVMAGDQCGVESCIHTPMECDDGDPCTADACVNGNCEFTPIPGCGCTFESDCDLGETCDNGMCVPTSGPDLEVGVGGGVAGCITTPFERFENGGLLQFCQGFQGLSDVWLTIRVKGFAPNASLRVTRSLSFVGVNCSTTPNCDIGLYCIDNLCSPIDRVTTTVPMTDVGGGVNQTTNYLFAMFFPPDYLEARDAVLTIKVEDPNNSAITATQVYYLTLFPRRLCNDANPCPIGQDCVNFYCVPQE